jgi:hypothetical protein
MPWPGFDVDQIVRLDHGCDIAVNELTAMVVHDPWPGTQRWPRFFGQIFRAA